jgi:hypothetical protein
MAAHPKIRPAARSNGLNDESIFGPPPVLEEEDDLAYDALRKRVTRDVKPSDILEKIWVRDAVDLTWETFRWRRLMTEVLSSDEFLACIDDVEKIDRLTMLAEARRNAAFREIERHRSPFAQNLRRTIDRVDEGEFKVIEHKGSAIKNTKRKNAA